MFPGTVTFGEKRVVVPSKTGFPPTKFAPGAVGDKNYSPLVTTDGHIVLDAPQVANASGQSDTVTNLNIPKRRVTLKLLRGWFDGTPVLYVRTDASVTLVAALEASTYAPNLSAAPGLGSDASTSARSTIIPVINGALSGPNRQGLESAVLSGKDPLNITQSFPGQPDYTPVWDLHPVVWTNQAIKDGKRVELTSDRTGHQGLQSRPSHQRRQRPRKREPPRRTPRDRLHLDLLDRRHPLTRPTLGAARPHQPCGPQPHPPSYKGSRPHAAHSPSVS